MIAALALADRLDEGAILAMHDALLAQVQPDIAGRSRDEQVCMAATRTDRTVPPSSRLIPTTYQP